MTKLEQIDESHLKVNPFSYTFKVPVNEIIKSDEFEKVEDEEFSEGLILNKTYYAERMQSTKIYYCVDCKEGIYNLSDKAQRMYLYILYNLKRGKDWIQINREYYMSKNNVKSINTFNGALKELVSEGFIATTAYKSVFWINPNLFFSGNRLAKFPNAIEVKQEIRDYQMKNNYEKS